MLPSRTANFVFSFLLATTSLQASTSTPLAVPAKGKTGFTRINPSDAGINFTNLCPATRSITNQIYLNGSGVAAGDIDGDGWCDLFFAGLENRSALYRNLGDWKFVNITASAGLTNLAHDVTGVAFADIDGDGDLDLVLNSVGNGTWIYLNDGKGKFAASGEVLNQRLGGTSLALADIDGDGDLDLYVANYRTATIRDQPNTRFSIRMVNGKPKVSMIDGRPVTDPDLAHRFNFNVSMAAGKGTFTHEENGEPDALFLNNGHGHFSPVSWTGGAFLDETGRPLEAPPFDWGLSVMMRDLNGDGRPDIYVCNDFKSPDRIWLNQDNGQFKAAPRANFRHLSLSSMGVDVADINRDGFYDIFVVDMLSRDHHRRLTQVLDNKPDIVNVSDIFARPQYPQNTLFLNRGDGTYSEIAWFSGLAATEWSWTPIFLDVDLDGFEDILISTGFERDHMNADVIQEIEKQKTSRTLSSHETLNLRKAFPRLATPNLAFRNLKNGKFADASHEWAFDIAGVSQGMILADLDNDGDMDVICNNFNEAPFLLRNDTAAPRISVSLAGLPPNTKGIGAEIRLHSEGLVQQQAIIAGGRYLSSDQALRSFAASPGHLELEVKWPSRRTSRLAVEANHHYEISESQSQPSLTTKNLVTQKAMFEDWSGRLNHVHFQPPYDDFAGQPSLPWKISGAGPAVGWFDLDNDGREDLFISSAKGGKPALHLNRGTNFALATNFFPETANHDFISMVGLKVGSSPRVLAVFSDFQQSPRHLCGVEAFSDGRKAELVLSLPQERCGPMALTDIDGDGNVDLFVGGAPVPGKYPLASPSSIYLQENGQFKIDPTRSAVLSEVGLVSAATFADMNGDGLPDLLLASQWAAPRIFLNTTTSLTEQICNLSNYPGLWNCIAAGDFDNDGKIDFVAGNLGNNTPYEAYREKGIRLYYGDFDQSGGIDLLEAYYSPELHAWAPLHGLDLLKKTVPRLAARFSSHAQFANSAMEQILEAAGSKGQFLSVTRFESTVFLNRGDHFEAIPLPPEAQFAPVLGIGVADFDGDGNQEIFLAQNFLNVRPESPRLDSGRGLLLKGNGRGGFHPLSSQESGIAIFGQQGACAAQDFDHDGRVDLIVTQTGGETKLYHNKTNEALSK
jgi:hypothetical protein